MSLDSNPAHEMLKHWALNNDVKNKYKPEGKGTLTHRTIVISSSESLSSGFDLNEYFINSCMKHASVNYV